MSTAFTFATDPGRALLHTWWRGLQERPGDRAVLRRAATVGEVAVQPAYVELARHCSSSGLPAYRYDAVAAIAALLAHVRDAIDLASPDAPRTAILLAGSADTPALHALRFQRLLATRTAEELYPHLRRALQLLRGRANIADLADSVLWWNERRRRDWAYDYYSHTTTT